MPAKVHLKPSGREFIVAGRESILEAGQRAGLNLPYGCANGNCGKCRARLLSGRLRQSQHFDYPLTEAERNSGVFLTCSHTAQTDLEIEINLTTNPGDIPQQDIVARVRKLTELSDQVRGLHLRLARADKLQFLAGQSVILGGNAGHGADPVPKAAHHIASCPCNSVNLEFHIPLIPGEAFSEYVFAGKLRPRDSLCLRGPQGQFVLFEDLRDVPKKQVRDDDFTLPPLIFIAWHTGFAPVRSLIEHAISLETEAPVHLYRLSPVPGNYYLDNLCRSWADAMDNLIYHRLKDRYTLMSPRAQAAAIIEKIAAAHPDLTAHEIYVAGPENLVFAAQKVLAKLGVPKDRLKTELVCLGFCSEDTA